MQIKQQFISRRKSDGISLYTANYGGYTTKNLRSCACHRDTACVAMKYADAATIAIDAIAVENEFCDHMFPRSKPDWLICNKPLEYIQFVLTGDLAGYLQGTHEHRLMD